MTKECEICGKYFDTNKSFRKYCDDCSPNQDKLKKYLAQDMARSRATYYEPILYSFKCENCGLEWKSTKRNSHSIRDKNGIGHTFCSKKCHDEALPNYIFCQNCGGPIDFSKPKITSNIVNGKEEYVCCEKCKDEYELKKAKIYGWYHTCEICGTDYIRRSRDSHWCSNECKIKYKERQKELSKNATVIRKEKCPVCGKIVTRNYPEKQIPTTVTCCCDEHTNIYIERCKRAQKILETSKYERAPKQKPKKIKPVHLCTSCKTSYKDCYLTKSNFRNAPKGAKYDNKGNITSCPLFR